jgi:hypothetical protein
MLPLIRPGDEITVKRLAWDEVWFSDIVVYRKCDELYVHRLLCKRKRGERRYFITKADRGFAFEGKIQEQDLIGKVIAVSRKGFKTDLQVSQHKIRGFVAGLVSLYVGLIHGLLRQTKRILIKNLERITRA